MSSSTSGQTTNEYTKEAERIRLQVSSGMKIHGCSCSTSRVYMYELSIRVYRLFILVAIFQAGNLKTWEKLHKYRFNRGAVWSVPLKQQASMIAQRVLVGIFSLGFRKSFKIV